MKEKGNTPFEKELRELITKSDPKTKRENLEKRRETFRKFVSTR